MNTITKYCLRALLALLVLAGCVALTSCNSYNSAAVTGHATGSVPSSVPTGPFGILQRTTYGPAGYGAAGPVGYGKSNHESEADKAKAFWGAR